MRHFATLFVTFFVIFVVLAMVAPLLISKDMIKRALIEQVQASTGRTLSIGGELTMHLFPIANVSMEDISLSGATRDGKGPMISAKSLTVGVEILPLFNKNVRIRKLQLTDPVLHLYVNRQGDQNWRFDPAEKPQAKPRERKQNPKAGSGKDAADGDAEETLFPNLYLDDVSIRNGSVDFYDELTKSQWSVDKLNVALSSGSYDAPLDISGDAVWNQKHVKVEAGLGSLKRFLGGEKSGIRVKLASEPLTADFDGSYHQGEYSGEASVSIPSVAALKQWMGDTAQAGAALRQKFNAETNLRCSNAGCDFAKLNLQFGDIKAAGSASVEFAESKPRLTLDLEADSIDLTPFMPAETKQSLLPSLTSEAHAAQGWSREPMDFSALNALNATVNVKTRELIAQQIKVGAATLRAKLNNGRLSADVLNASLYGGKGDVTFSYDTASAMLEKRVSLAGVNAEPFLSDAMGQDRLSGKANMDINVVGRGVSEYDIVSSLQGTGQVKFLDGAIRGINIAEMIRNVKSAFSNVDSGAQKTDFAELGGTFTIADGIVKNNDLAMKAPLLRVSGAGQVNLPARTVNYRLVPEVVETTQGQGGKDKQGLGVPVIVEGTFDRLTFRPDLESIARDAIQNPEKVKETVKGIKEQFKGENKKEAIENLKGLLKGR